MLPEDLADLSDADTLARGVPHDTFRALRREAPVYFQKERSGGRGFWVVTQYSDIVVASKDPQRFSSARGGTNIEDFTEEDLSLIRLIMLNMDPPQHAKFRRLVNYGFTPLVISFLEPRIRLVTAQLLDKIARRGEADFVTSVAAELPLQVIAELLGIPMADRQQLFEWTNRLVGFSDPEFGSSIEGSKAAAMNVWMYANQLAEERKHQTDEHDLATILMNAEVDGFRLSEAEFDAFFLLLAVAGNETTRNLVSGGMFALMEHPEEHRRLLADPSLIPSGVEEMLRWVTPVVCFRRTATCDTVLHGQKIRENDKVVLYYASANRDESVFPEPDRFDVGRTPNEHLAFGVGEHFCLGSSLARLEIRILFTEILRRFPDMALAGPVSRLRSDFLNGIKHMPVRFTPEKG
jgi:cholest-4-en-3-one 26-monooxygenase